MPRPKIKERRFSDREAEAHDFGGTFAWDGEYGALKLAYHGRSIFHYRENPSKDIFNVILNRGIRSGPEAMDRMNWAFESIGLFAKVGYVLGEENMWQVTIGKEQDINFPVGKLNLQFVKMLDETRSMKEVT